jgi:hypothetical protein
MIVQDGQQRTLVCLVWTEYSCCGFETGSGGRIKQQDLRFIIGGFKCEVQLHIQWEELWYFSH